MTLFFVQADKEYVLVKRRGRFSITEEEAASPIHFLHAIENMQEMMIWGLKKKGYEYVDDGFEIRGPEEHINYSTDSETDPGPNSMPTDLDPDKLEKWERAERARVARKQRDDAHDVDLVDYILVATFKKPTEKIFISR